ncbi:hypothetical protein LZK76_35880 (plasmid) [Rhizobium leguminosarum]|nr:hypothetical protein LZK76_35880 [Rhizobium leguminosarum]
MVVWFICDEALPRRLVQKHVNCVTVHNADYAGQKLRVSHLDGPEMIVSSQLLEVRNEIAELFGDWRQFLRNQRIQVPTVKLEP